MMNIRYLPIIFLMSFTQLTQAICLSDPDFSNECRYKQGDDWCTKEIDKKFAFKDECLSQTNELNARLHTEAILPENKRWLIIASRNNLKEAETLAKSYQATFKDTAILLADNGFYAITIGNAELATAKNWLAELIATNKIPKDTFLATGHDLFYKTTENNLSNSDEIIKSAVIDKKGNVHIFNQNGAEVYKTASGNRGDLMLSKNKKIALWMNIKTTEENVYQDDGQLYMTYIDTSPNIYIFSTGKLKLFECDYGVHGYNFMDNETKLILVCWWRQHSPHYIHAYLYDIRTMKLIDTYDRQGYIVNADGDSKNVKPPRWYSEYDPKGDLDK